MPIVVGIDGTGSAFTPGKNRDKEYDKAFKNSFVRRICLKPDPDFGYWRGPVALGGGLVPAINGAYEFIRQRRQAGGGPVLLTGYSRGAAGVVSLAKKMQRAGMSVKAMLLFDCVDRHMFIDAEIIPNNVVDCLHLIRNPKAGSRESFSNDGMYYRSPTKMGCFHFMCTHGGMGGVPWEIPEGKKGTDKIVEGEPDGETNITYEQDKQVSDQIWTFIRGYRRKHGFTK